MSTELLQRGTDERRTQAKAPEKRRVNRAASTAVPWWSLLLAVSLAASTVFVIRRAEPTTTQPESRAATEVAASAPTSAALVAGDIALSLETGVATVTVDDRQIALTTTQVGEVEPSDQMTVERDGEVVNRFTGIEEWYRKLDTGFEHGYTIEQPVSGDDLRITVGVEGGQPISVSPTAAMIAVGDDALAYRDLHAFDADGRALDASMTVDDSTIVIDVDVAGARYPVTVDPIISEDFVLRSSFANSEFGTSVAIDGNRMAVGVPGAFNLEGETTSPTNGIVQMFERTAPGAPWTPDGILVNPFPSYSEFGAAVDLAGDRVAVGLPNSVAGEVANQGLVRIYETNGVSWSLLTEIGASDSAYGFGFSVDFVDRDHLIIGAPGIIEAGGTTLGPGQVYEWRSGAVSLIDTGALGPGNDKVGYSVAGDRRPGGGVRIVVGAPGDAGAGLVRVLDDPEQDGTYTIVHELGSSDAGRAVDVSGDRYAFSTTNNVFVYVTEDGGTAWTNEATTNPGHGTAPGNYNDFLDLEGGTLAVGAPSNNQVQIYRYDGFTWSNVDQLRPTGAAGTDLAGYAIALDGTTLAVGAPNDDGVGDATNDSGAVFTREIPLVANFSVRGTSGAFLLWNDPANWDVGIVPGPGDQAIIAPNGLVNVDDTRTVARIVVKGQLEVRGDLAVSGASEVTTSGIVWGRSGGIFNLPDLLGHEGQIILNGGTQMRANGPTQIVGAGIIANSAIVEKFGVGELTIDGADWNASPGSQLIASQGDIRFVTSGYDPQGITWAQPGTRVVLNGDVRLQETSQVIFGIDGPSSDLNNFGRIEIPTGRLFRDAVGGEPAAGTLSANISGYTPQASDLYPVIVCSVSCEGDNNRFETTATGPLDVIPGPITVSLRIVENKVTSPTPGQQQFGAAVDNDGAWAAVGEPDSVGGGAVHVIQLSGGQWVDRQTLTIDDTPDGALSGDGFGTAVAIEGNYLAVASPNSGNQVYVFTRPNFATPFSFAYTVTVDPEGGIDLVDGVLIVVGDSGLATVGNLTPTAFNVVNGTLAVSATSTDVALGGDIAGGTGWAAVADPSVGDGEIRIFSQAGGSWNSTPVETIISPEGASGSFGTRIDASGDRLVVGDQLNDTGAGDAGAVFVYEGSAGVFGAPTQKLQQTDVLTGSVFGSDVAISGGTIAVGAGASQVLGRPYREGAAFVFRYDPLDGFVERDELRPVDGGNQERFGDAISLSDNDLLVGARRDVNDNGPDAGAVYTYRVPVVATFVATTPGATWDDPTSWDIDQVPTAVDTAIVPDTSAVPTLNGDTSIGRLFTDRSIDVITGSTVTVFGNGDGPSFVGDAVITVLDDARLEIFGDLTIDSDGIVTTEPPGTFDPSTIFVGGDVTIDGQGTIVNDGAIVKSGSGPLTIGSQLAVTNGPQSLVAVDGGDLTIQSFSFDTGTSYRVSADSTITFPGAVTLTPTSTVDIGVDSDTGESGLISLPGGLLTRDGTLQITNRGSAPVEDGAPYLAFQCESCLGGAFDSLAIAGLDVIPTGNSLTIGVGGASLDFTFDVSAGADVTVATGIDVNSLDPATRAAGTSVAAASLTEIGADNLDPTDPAATPLTAIEIGATPLTAIVLESEVLSAIPLVNIDVDGGWGPIIAGSELENEPLASLTFGQVLTAGDPSQAGYADTPAGRFAATPLTAIEVDGTALSTISLGAIVLGDTPLTAIPLTAIDPDLDWCDIVADLVPAGTTCDDAFLGDLNVLEVTLRGVPLTAIPLTAIPLTAIDVTESPLTAIPLTAIELAESPLTAIPLTAIDIAQSPLTAIDVADLPLTAIPLTAIPLTAIPLTAIDVNDAPLTAIPLTAIDANSTSTAAAPLTAIPLTAILLADTPLTAIPLTAIDNDASWCDLLADADGPDCTTGIDPQSTTLRELLIRGVPLTAIPLTAIPLTAIDVSASGLADIPLTAIPLTAIPLTAIPLTAIDVEGLSLDQTPLTAIDVADTPLTAIPLTAIDLAGTPLTAIQLSDLPLTAIPLTAIPLTAIQVGSTTLGDVRLTDLNIGATPLTAIPLTAIPLTAIDCSRVDCARDSLGDAAANAAIRSSARLTDIQSALSGVRLADIVAALPGAPSNADIAQALADAGLTIGSLTDFDDLTLGEIPAGLYGNLTLGQLGDAVGGTTLGDLVGRIIDPASGESVADVDAQIRLAIELLTLYTELGDLDSLGEVTLGDLLDGLDPSESVNLLDVEPLLGFITVQALFDALGVLLTVPSEELGSLTERELGNLTLADLVGLITSGNVGDLLGSIDDALAQYTLGDLLLALVDPGSLALGGVDFADVELLDLPPGIVPASTFRAAFTLTDTSLQRPVSVEVKLPPGSEFVAGSGSVSATAPGGGGATAEIVDPTVDGQTLRWSFLATPDTEYAVGFDALPSLRIGSTSLAAQASVGGTDIVVPATASVQVLEPAEPNDFPDPDVISAFENTVYLTYISSPTDNDVYSIDVGEGDQLSAELSNLTADFDLVLWGRADDPDADDPLSGASADDPLVVITDPDADGADSEPLDDFRRLDDVDPSLNLVAISNRDGEASERIDTGRLPAGTYYFQVYGSNGATSPRPAAFQIAVEEADLTPPCSVIEAPFAAGMPAGPIPAIGEEVNTLILWNEQRLEQFYGPQGRQDVAAALAELTTFLAGDPTINPAIVAVDGDANVRAAFTDWDADSCDVEAANDVVAAINADVIDPVRGQLDHVVILGGDELIPMARLRDSTKVANEYDYRYEFIGDITGDDPDNINAATASFWESRILSDEPYGDSDARSLGDRYLYVTDLALGRVVETPDDIVDALGRYVQYDGTLDIDTATVLGYDFLIDGSEAVADEIRQSLPTGTSIDDELADGIVDATGTPWDRAAATAKLAGAATNALISLNAHFDHYRALPAIGDKVPGFDDNLIAEDVAATLGPEALLRSLIFSMGCHSGLPVSDIAVASTNTDWAETLGQQGALFVGNTGFGYGDTVQVAYTELLMQLYARRVTSPLDLDPTGTVAASTVGQALAWAKNDYVANIGTFSVYDEKAVMESTFYGLPFYRIGAAAPIDELPEVPTNEETTDGELDGGVTLTPTNTTNPTPSGTYFSNPGPDGEELVIVAPGRPIQPKIVEDISIVDPTDTTQLATIARGAIIEQMTSRYVDLPDPVVATPVFDEAAGQPEPEATGSFPAQPLTITSTKGPEGQRQRLVAATGQYRAGPKVQRLDDSLEFSVYYSDRTELDFTAPRIGAVTTELVGGALNIRVPAQDVGGSTVERVYVLVAPDPGVGPVPVTWIGENLTQSLTDGTVWEGSVELPPGTSRAEAIVQVKDTAGNVGFATNKARNFGQQETAPVLPPDADPDLDVQIDGTAGTNGWFRAPVAVTATATADVSLTVDGQTRTSPATVTAPGPHTWRATTGIGEVQSGQFRIDDDTPPTITVSSPTTGQSVVAGAPVRYAVACDDLSIDRCRLRIRRTDGQGSPSQIVQNGALLPTTPGSYVLDVLAIDSVGLSATASRPFSVTAPVGAPTLRTVTGPTAPQEITETVTIAATFADVSGVYDDYTATVAWGDGTSDTVTIGTGDEPTPAVEGRFTASHLYATTGIYSATVTIDDGAGGSDVEMYEFIVVFDSTTDASVYGSGYYWSGSDAYAGSPRWGSPAVFGYRAYYPDGAGTPSGITKLRLVGEFYFRSTSYDYLIVNDTMATAEGVGTIGDTEYRFRVQGIDNGWLDFFQLTIWDDATGDVLYDNGVRYDEGDLVLLGGIRVRS